MPILKTDAPQAGQTPDEARAVRDEARDTRPFGRVNFLLMGGCLLLIIAGFILMSGPGSSPEAGFNPDIFSTRRIVAGPTVCFLGFMLMAVAIVWNPARKGRRTAKN